MNTELKLQFSGAKNVEKDLFEEGIESMFDYMLSYEGENVLRSEQRLYGVYESIGKILKFHGMANVSNALDHDSNTTLYYTGNVYDGNHVSGTTVNTDLIFNKPNDVTGVIRGVEVRFPISNIGKNIYNNVRSIIGEREVFNKIVRHNSGVKRDFFYYMHFLDLDNKETTKVISNLLFAYEAGLQVIVVPYFVNDDVVNVRFNAVPECIQLPALFK